MLPKWRRARQSDSTYIRDTCFRRSLTKGVGADRSGFIDKLPKVPAFRYGTSILSHVSADPPARIMKSGFLRMCIYQGFKDAVAEPRFCFLRTDFERKFVTT